jgi:hypothetical protein
MRNLPIDAGRLNLVSAGKVAPRFDYTDNVRNEHQATDDQGTLLWSVDCLVDDEDARRAEIVSVIVAAPYQPVVKKFDRVEFTDVTAVIYTDRGTGRASVSLRAGGVVEQRGSVKAVRDEAAG